MHRENGENEEGVLLKLKEFGQATTWHGIRYLFEGGHTSRKIAWLTVILVALTGFCIAVGYKLLEYFEHNSQIQMLTTYPMSLPFPRVTICNSNPYRMSKVVEFGLHDTFLESHLAASDTNINDISEDTCVDFFTLNTSRCYDPFGAIFSYIYQEVTSRVCSELCLRLEPIRCAGYLYNTKTRECVLSSATNYIAETCQQRNWTKYYVRQRCVEPADIRCDFEEGSLPGENKCQMTRSITENDEFLYVQGTDHTIGLEEGHFLYLLETNNREGYRARIGTSFLLLHNSCLQLFYTKTGYANIRVILKAENLTETDVVTRISPGNVTEWTPLFVTLPFSGIYQVVIEASRLSSPEEGGVYSGSAIDDIRIEPCESFRQDICRKTYEGKEYLGSKSVSKSGVSCGLWNQSLHLLQDEKYFFQNAEDENRNFCRNPTADDTPPWCFINEKGKRETCDVPICLCRDGWHTCAENGVCIPEELLCNGVKDCKNGDDEGESCQHLVSLDCGFESAFLCGYSLNPSQVMTWTLTDTFNNVAAGDRRSMHLDYSIAIPGTKAQLVSPLVEFTEEGAIAFQLIVKKDLFDQGTSFSVKLIAKDGTEAASLRIIWADKDFHLVCVPVGTFSLLFTATLGTSARPDVVFDNVQQHDKSSSIYGRTVEQHCASLWPQLKERQVFDRLRCKFDTDDCSVNIGYSSNTKYDWVVIPAYMVASDEPVPPVDACEARYQHEEYAAITSPGYPVGYPNNADCYVTIKHDSALLRIQFLDMDIVPSLNCSQDYVEIYEGANATNVVLKACGDSLPLNVETRFSETVIHFHSDQGEVGRGYSLNFSQKRQYAGDQALGLIYTGDKLGFPLANILSLPRLDISGHYCLSFDFLARHATTVYMSNTMIKRTGTPLMEVFYDYSAEGVTDDWLRNVQGLGDAWHPVVIQLEGLANETTFISIFTRVALSTRVYTTGINNLQLLPGHCENLFDSGSVNCDFTVSQCGYLDISLGPNKWLRGFNNITGEYRIFTVLGRQATTGSNLVTPPVLISQTSCLHIVLTYTGLSIALRVTQHYSYENFVPLRVFDLLDLFSDSVDVEIQVPLDVGHYRLGIEAEGWASSISIQRVFIQDSSCLGTTGRITDRTFWLADQDVVDTTEGPTVESLTEEPSVITPPKEYTHSYQTRLEAAEIILTNLIDDQEGEDLNKLVIEGAHKLNDTILSCKWNGEICSDDMITEVVTDMGQCFAFNYKGDDIYHTYVPGAEKGLRLVLNAEGYEQLLASTGDRGFEVLLDYQDDMQHMRDKGFGISPGTHILAAMSYSEGVFIKPPCGTCGDVQLPHYVNETYTYVRCTRSCAIEDLLNTCSCGDSFMEGQISVCDMKTYFNCVLPSLYAAEQSTDDVCAQCISTCNIYDYRTTLSSTMLLSKTLYLLPDAITRQMKQNFIHATELEQRIKIGPILTILENLKIINKTLQRLETYVEFNLLDFRTSIIWRTEKAIEIFQSLTDEHYGKIYGYIKGFESPYVANMSGIIETVTSSTETMLRVFTTASVLQSHIIQSSAIGLDNDILKSYPLKLKLFVDTCETFMTLTTSESFIGKDLTRVNLSVLGDSLPKYLIAPHWKTTLCSQRISSIRVDDFTQIVSRNLNELQTIGFFTNQELTNQSINAIIALAKEMAKQQTAISRNLAFLGKQAKECMLGFQSFLSSIANRQQDFLIPTFSYSTDLSVSKTLSGLRQSAVEIDGLFQDFSVNRIGAIELSQSFGDTLSGIQDVLDQLASRLLVQILTPMASDLDDLQEKYFDNIMTSLDDAILMTAYVPQMAINIQNLFRTFDLWRLPVTDLTSRELVRMTLDPKVGYDVIGADLDVFRNTSGQAFVKQALEGFFSSIDSSIAQVTRTLPSLKNAALNQLYDLSAFLHTFDNIDIFSSDFVGDNIVKLDIYYSDMSRLQVVQKCAYDKLAFFSDFGGYMGLLLGASIISLVEVIDWIIFNFILNRPGPCGTKQHPPDQGNLRPSQTASRMHIKPNTNTKELVRPIGNAAAFTNGKFIEDRDSESTESSITASMSKAQIKSTPQGYRARLDDKRIVSEWPSDYDYPAVERKPDYEDEFGNNYYM